RGYQIVKSYDENNLLRLFVKLEGVALTNITRHDNGIIYIAGNFGPGSAKIGDHQITGNNNTYSSFLAAINDVPLAVPRYTKSNDFNVYPNPGNGKVEFIFTQDRIIGQLHIRVLNMLGQEVSTSTMEISSNSYQGVLDLSKELKGIY